MAPRRWVVKAVVIGSQVLMDGIYGDGDSRAHCMLIMIAFLIVYMNSWFMDDEQR